MNARRVDDNSNERTPQDAVDDLLRASASAMEMAMKGVWTKDSEAQSAPVHPFVAHPAAMMTAATVVGLGVSSQMAGMWLGFMKGVSEASDAARGEHEQDFAEAVTTEGQSSPAEKAEPPKSSARVRVVVDNDTDQVVSPAQPDDLKLLPGVGPKLASVLASKGFASFKSIASMSATDEAKLDGELGLDGRILADDWRGAAARLMAGAN